MEFASSPGPLSPEENLLEQARFYIEYGRWEQAEPVLRRAIAQFPDAPLPRVWLGLTLGRLRRVPEGLQEVHTAVALAPEWPYPHLIAGYLQQQQGKHKQAEGAAREALRLAPDLSGAYELLSQSLFNQGRWAEALTAAERGLEADASDVGCANMRAMALTKLRRRDDAHAALETALANDPENALTHANHGWALLEAKRHREAMEAFREALRLDPHQEWARQGIISAMKARNPIYRVMLGYFFWMARLRPQVRTGVVAGLWILNQVLHSLADANPALRPYLNPLLALYLLFVVLTWTADPLFNLMLRFDPIGRYVLNEKQQRTASGVGVCMLLGFSAVVTYLFTQSDAVAIIGGLGVFAILPVLWFTKTESRFMRWATGIGTAAFALLALAFAVAQMIEQPLPIALLFGLFALGVGVYTIALRRKA